MVDSAATIDFVATSILKNASTTTTANRKTPKKQTEKTFCAHKTIQQQQPKRKEFKI
jgi:hypothetical protein